MRIEDYALVGDMQSAALISTAGAVRLQAAQAITSAGEPGETLAPAQGLRIAALA